MKGLLLSSVRCLNFGVAFETQQMAKLILPLGIIPVARKEVFPLQFFYLNFFKLFLRILTCIGNLVK